MEHRQQVHRRRPQRRRRSFLGRLLTFLVICLILFLGVSVFFRVSRIQVVGDIRYTDQQVVAASGVSSGEHLFFINDEAIIRSIRSQLPYVGQVEVRRQFPNRLEITVAETVPLALVRLESGYLILDRDARILERTDQTPAMRLIVIEGIDDPLLPREGEILAPGEGSRDKLRYLQDILGRILMMGITSRVSSIDMTELYDPTMFYEERIIVHLGPNRDLDHKMDMLLSIMETIGEDETGVLDLGQERIVFRAGPIEVNRPDNDPDEEDAAS